MAEQSLSPKPSVSIIIPVFNAASTIDQCLNSICQQQLQSFEVLLVDDGSTDNSVDICKQWSNKNSQFQLIPSTQNAGASAARNIGINAAQGEFITFVDADDWIEPNMLSDMTALANKNNADIVCCSHRQNREHGEFQKADGTPVHDMIFNQNLLLDYLIAYLQKPYYYTLFVHCWGKLYRRTYIQHQGLLFDESLDQLEDVHFNMRACKNADNISYKQGYFYHHRIQTSSMSSQSGTETDPVKKMQKAFSPVKVLLEALDKDKQYDADKLFSKLFINTMVITLIRLSRGFMRRPNCNFFRRVRFIVKSEQVKTAINYYAPGKGESHLLFHALKLGSPSLVALAGVIRASVIAMKK